MLEWGGGRLDPGTPPSTRAAAVTQAMWPKPGLPPNLTALLSLRTLTFGKGIQPHCCGQVSPKQMYYSGDRAGIPGK